MKRRNDDKAKKWIGGFIISIMVLSVAAFGASFVTNSGNSLERYNGFKFTQSVQTGQWEVEVNDVLYRFLNHPTQVAHHQVEGNVVETLNEAFAVSVTFSPDLESPEYVDFARFKIGEFFTERSIPVTQGILSKNESYELATFTCDDAASFSPVIVFALGNETQVTLDNNCIQITELSEFGLVELSEAILYRLLGVIQ